MVREVDTYFSLGIEFDQGKRIASDDALIDSDPAIFCSFYNVPCPAATLEELNETASYFTIIAALYPRSFFLLSLELNRPILDLFFAFLDRVAEIEGEISRTGHAPCRSHHESAAHWHAVSTPPYASGMPGAFQRFRRRKSRPA